MNYNLHNFTLKATVRLSGVIQCGCTVLSNYERRGLLPGQFMLSLLWIYLRIVRECLLSLGAESFVFQVAIQKLKD
jgi:hypothetical protein